MHACMLGARPFKIATGERQPDKFFVMRKKFLVLQKFYMEFKFIQNVSWLELSPRETGFPRSFTAQKYSSRVHELSSECLLLLSDLYAEYITTLN